MKAHIHVYLKKAVLDPQGKAIAHALNGLGYNGVLDARQGKMIELDLDDSLTPDQARAEAEKMCEALLANTVIEDYSVEIAA